jgi:hypothetical protein
MTMSFRVISAAAALALGFSTVLLAQSPALDVKLGLWEISSTTEIGGQMPQVDAAGMTPQQQAQMEAAMKAMMGAHTDTSKTCMTKEKLDRSNILDPGDPDMACKQTFGVNTRTTLDGSVTCTGDHAMTAQMHVEAASPTAFKAMIKSSNTEQGRTMTLNIAMTGKWLAADCGNVD